MSDTKEPGRLQLELPAGAPDDWRTAGCSTAANPELPGGEVMTVLKWTAARAKAIAAPPYHRDAEKRIEGLVAVQYVVDTTGRADVELLVLSTTHVDFARSVKATLPMMRFRQPS
jgi:hypothetical protein